MLACTLTRTPSAHLLSAGPLLVLLLALLLPSIQGLLSWRRRKEGLHRGSSSSERRCSAHASRRTHAGQGSRLSSAPAWVQGGTQAGRHASRRRRRSGRDGMVARPATRAPPPGNPSHQANSAPDWAPAQPAGRRRRRRRLLVFPDGPHSLAATRLRCAAPCGGCCRTRSRRSAGPAGGRVLCCCACSEERGGGAGVGRRGQGARNAGTVASCRGARLQHSTASKPSIAIDQGPQAGAKPADRLPQQNKAHTRLTSSRCRGCQRASLGTLGAPAAHAPAHVGTIEAGSNMSWEHIPPVSSWRRHAAQARQAKQDSRQCRPIGPAPAS